MGGRKTPVRFTRHPVSGESTRTGDFSLDGPPHRVVCFLCGTKEAGSICEASAEHPASGEGCFEEAPLCREPRAQDDEGLRHAAQISFGRDSLSARYEGYIRGTVVA
jgi:hypothetical protein